MVHTNTDTESGEQHGMFEKVVDVFLDALEVNDFSSGTAVKDIIGGFIPFAR